jgi:NADH dehydrogenase/NADH:ubiquinone oxidoreductase subunit G
MIITIDGKTCSCEPGESLLLIAKRNDIFIPTLCYHEGLGGIGACRLCIVEVVEGARSKVVVSCMYPVEREIEVFTASDKIKEQRGVVLALLARLAPNADVIQQMTKFMGAELPRLSDKAGGDTCVLCGRCTTACELVGSGAIAKVNRGTTKAIDTPYGQPSSECIGCASCANVCPTKSIDYTETATTVTIWGRTFDLKRCEHCDKPISTDELIANASHKVEGDERVLCIECRKKALADNLIILGEVGTGMGVDA